MYTLALWALLLVDPGSIREEHVVAPGRAGFMLIYERGEIVAGAGIGIDVQNLVLFARHDVGQHLQRWLAVSAPGQHWKLVTLRE